MGANLGRVEPQALEAELGGVEAKEGDDVSSGDAFRECALDEKIVADGGVRFVLV